jgi:hypothetical protein
MVQYAFALMVDVIRIGASSQQQFHDGLNTKYCRDD